jgi:hypothetical protein
MEARIGHRRKGEDGYFMLGRRAEVYNCII